MAAMPRLWRIFWLVVLGGHLAAAGAGWWLWPGGFPVGHPRFWVNGVGPLIVMAAVGVAVGAARGKRMGVLRIALAAFPVFWGAAAGAGRVVFPVSSLRIWMPAMGVAAVMGVGAWWPFRKMERPDWRGMGAVMAVAAGLGVLAPWSQRGPEADTRPSGDAGSFLAESVGEKETGEDTGRVSDRVRVAEGDGTVSARMGGLTLDVSALLTFLDRSPDRCWTILAPADVREGPRLVMEGMRRSSTGVEFTYRRGGRLGLKVEDGEAIRIEATAELDQEVYSHLNSFADVMVTGHERLGVAFSPCEDVVVEVLPADYPTGRPMRLAYLGRDGIFRVVEASDGEKGPFRELGSGPLERGEPLGMTFFDEGRPVARMTLEDWSAQAGVQLSPTAGWGVPVNAIEFVRTGNDPKAPAAFYCTLAGTGVGRGWDSVGHREGVYRNRVKIEEVEGE